MKVPVPLLVLILSLIVPAVQADTFETASQAVSSVPANDGLDCGVRNETVCWTIDKACIFVRIVRHLIEPDTAEIPPPCTESAALADDNTDYQITVASASGWVGLTDCPQTYPYQGDQPYEVQYIYDCKYICEGHVFDAGQWYGTCVLVGQGYSQPSTTMLVFMSETCSNYGVRVVVSLGESCKNGTCNNEGILIVVGSFCGRGPAEACVDDICVFSLCDVICVEGDSSATAVATQSGAACQYGITVSALGVCVLGIDTSCSPTPCVESDLTVPAASASARSMQTYSVINVGDCQFNPSIYNTLICGEEGEVCSVLESPECWAGRLVCVYIKGPISQLYDLIRREGEPCRTQPGCCASSVQATLVTVGDCEINPDLWGVLLCGEEGEICSMIDSPECWAGRMACTQIRGPMGEVQHLFPHVEEPPCTTQPGCCSSSINTNPETSTALQQTITQPCEGNTYGIVVAVWALGFCVQVVVGQASAEFPSGVEGFRQELYGHQG